jgi:arginine:ornithine antiporter/lysine permease
MAAASQNRLSLFSASALVIGSMIGAGVFYLPRTFGVATGQLGALIASRLAAGGMDTLSIPGEGSR